MSLNYDQYVLELTTLAASSTNDQYFMAMIPNVISYAEERCYRELDLLNTVTTNATLSFTAGTRSLTLPTSPARFITVQQINAITPVSTAPDSGTRNPLTPTTKEFLDNVWGSSTGTDLPEYFAMVTDQSIIVGPWPDGAYRAEIVGTIRPTPLSPENPETYLSLYLPDLFTAASMVFVAGYQKNFGSQADDPKMAQSWEAQYRALFASANVEENRKKFASSAWASMQPTPVATPSR